VTDEQQFPFAVGVSALEEEAARAVLGSFRLVQMLLDGLGLEVQSDIAALLADQEGVVGSERLEEGNEAGLALEGHLNLEVWQSLQRFEHLILALLNVGLLQSLTGLDVHLQHLPVFLSNRELVGALDPGQGLELGIEALVGEHSDAVVVVQLVGQHQRRVPQIVNCI
jgi:hypothetical protein